MATNPKTAEATLETLSEPLRKAVEALVVGLPIPAETEAALTPDERAELNALVHTAQLTYLTLQQPAPPPEAEARSLAKAQDALAGRPPVGPDRDTKPRPALLAWWERLRRGREEE
jgi:sugar phosphate isomerase/epimerase